MVKVGRYWGEGRDGGMARLQEKRRVVAESKTTFRHLDLPVFAFSMVTTVASDDGADAAAAPGDAASLGDSA